MKRIPKLIEVALPLDAINREAAREKSIRHGHPSTLHLWWARRPLAAARAVLFSQLVDDPSGRPELFPTESEQEKERKRLFEILRELVRWENTTNERVLEAARQEIRESWRRTCSDNADHPEAATLFDPERLPAFHDPFAGGGAIPLEAQRLGLEAHASDLNPVAVLINKAMIEVPPRFAGRPPVRPSGTNLTGRSWKGAAGLAEDVRHYGAWMRDEAERRIGHLYPKVRITEEMVQERPDLERYAGRELTVIAWLWARTVRSPNPAFADVEVPLASTFMLSTKPGREAYVEPVIEGRNYRFTVKMGVPQDPAAAKRGTKIGGSHSPFFCLLSGSPMPFTYLRTQGKTRRLGSRLMAIVADGGKGRIYLAPQPQHASAGRAGAPTWMPEMALPDNRRDFKTPNYGLDTFADLFTSRQLAALTTFSDLVGEAMERVRRDAAKTRLTDDGRALRDGGTGATAYAEAVGLYLSFALSKQADLGNSLCRWEPIAQCPRQLFGRQAIPMVWDFAEGNPLGQSSGSWTVFVNGIVGAFIKAFGGWEADHEGLASQVDAGAQRLSAAKVVSTDPPYYDNVGYADLSDFFYVWLRRSLKSALPDLFATVAVPKAQELVATPYRHGSKTAAETFFLEGMTRAMHRLTTQAHSSFPVTIYYAFKQTETRTGAGSVSTGWETFLDAVLCAGLSVTATWPMRTENASRMVGQGTNALASSIVLACRRRPDDAPLASRRELVAALRDELPPALRLLQSEDIAPVDLAQAAIGPGMRVYTRYARVLRASGEPVPVREALALINEVLDEVLEEQEGELDAPTRWAVEWFRQHGFQDAPFGDAETLSKAKAASVEGMVAAGIVTSAGGRVRLVAPEGLPENWDPANAAPLTAWAAVHHLCRQLDEGKDAAAGLLRRLGSTAETARDLAYRLYASCEKKGWSADAFRYNALVRAWPDLRAQALGSGAGRKGARLL